MTEYRIEFVGPATMAIQVATELADAAGVDLTSSDPPAIVSADAVALRVTARGSAGALDAAVATIRGALSPGSSIEILDVLDA